MHVPSEDELAAIAVAWLAVSATSGEPVPANGEGSRWSLAGRLRDAGAVCDARLAVASPSRWAVAARLRR